MDSNAWIAIGTAVAAAIALAALWVSLHTKWENRRYKSPAFRLEPGGIDAEGNPTLILRNNGESSARNVRLTLNVDPTGIFTGSPLEWDVIDKDEPVTITFTPHRGLLEPTSDTWFIELFMTNPASRNAVVEFHRKVGKPVRQELLTPSTQQLAAWEDHPEGHRSDSQEQ